MKLGLLTACFPQLELTEVADRAAAVGFEALEVAVWPRDASRPFVASHLDVARLDPAGADRVRSSLADKGLEISALAYYENNLDADLDTRASVHDHLRRCVDAAVLLGCSRVGTFIGRHLGLSLLENLRLGEEVLPPLVAHAEERGVELVIENCPMEGWHPDLCPANLAYSPELWEWMFDLGLFLNFDPSHLVWLGIDPATALAPHVGRVRHVQAKDTQVDRAARNRYGCFGRIQGKASPWDTGWWRYRVPGRGEVDWRQVIDVLDEGGFQGVVSVEHEDPVWGGSVERTQQGLEIAHATLRPLIRDESKKPEEGSMP